MRFLKLTESYGGPAILVSSYVSKGLDEIFWSQDTVRDGLVATLITESFRRGVAPVRWDV